MVWKFLCDGCYKEIEVDGVRPKGDQLPLVAVTYGLVDELDSLGGVNSKSNLTESILCSSCFKNRELVLKVVNEDLDKAVKEMEALG